MAAETIADLLFVPYSLQDDFKNRQQRVCSCAVLNIQNLSAAAETALSGPVS